MKEEVSSVVEPLSPEEEDRDKLLFIGKKEPSKKRNLYDEIMEKAEKR